jgi:hypothetical protein
MGIWKMNERIRELVKQAGGRFSTHTLTSYPAQHRESIELWDKNIEKFAELIVEECIEQVWYSREDGINGNISEVIKERMKQHFGVDK